MTNKKSKIFFIIIILLILISLSVTYYKYVILMDFETFTDEEIFYQELEIE